MVTGAASFRGATGATALPCFAASDPAVTSDRRGGVTAAILFSLGIGVAGISGPTTGGHARGADTTDPGSSLVVTRFPLGTAVAFTIGLPWIPATFVSRSIRSARRDGIAAGGSRSVA